MRYRRHTFRKERKIDSVRKAMIIILFRKCDYDFRTFYLTCDFCLTIASRSTFLHFWCIRHAVVEFFKVSEI